ncbi:MAG: DUF2071 domain-containing protein, partial [Pirellulales bacterium]|nr:DUF2071 domain-containing protein [Pirellulales bacterium]
LPRTPWIMRMTWSELLFAHWSFEPDIVARHLPDGLSLDVRDGRAWIGVVPFLMSDVAPRCCPPLPRLSRFLELNVRTYVVIDGKPGVWFFSLDAASRLAVRVARKTFSLPYMDAKMSLERDDADRINYQSARTHRGEPAADFAASYRRQGEPFEARAGTLEHWLTARYCLYSADQKGNIYRGEINHPPWTLRKAECDIEKNTMGDTLGFTFDEPPHLLYAEPIRVHAWAITRCASR